MQFFDFTISFDDELHSLNAKNGLPIDKLAEMLSALNKAINLAQDDKLVLSEVRGNCYALNLSTNSIVVHENLKVIHNKISKNDFIGLNEDQKKYASKLKIILGDNLYLKAYDTERNFNVKVENIILPKPPDFYFDIVSIYGIITSIGGKTLSGKSIIHLNTVAFDIEINYPQEKELIQFYKSAKIRLLIRRKINSQTKQIISATLESFERVSDESISHKSLELRKRINKELYQSIKNHPNYQ